MFARSICIVIGNKKREQDAVFIVYFTENKKTVGLATRDPKYMLTETRFKTIHNNNNNDDNENIEFVTLAIESLTFLK
jgi:hypothetical protein